MFKKIQKHTLFKKIKVFDVVVASILLIIGIGLFLLFYRKAEYINIRVRVTDQEVLYSQTLPRNWYAQRFVVGDFELDALGRKITEIQKVERFTVNAERDVVVLDLNVRATYDTRTKMYSTRGKPIMFGAPMRFNLQGITFDGIVTEFPGSDKLFKAQESVVTVRAMGRGIEPYLAEAVTEGKVVYDSNQVALAKVLAVEIRPAERVTETDRGDLLLRNDPLYKDIYLTVEIKTKVIQGSVLMFDSIPVKVDQMIPLNFEEVSIFPTIIDIL